MWDSGNGYALFLGPAETGAADDLSAPLVALVEQATRSVTVMTQQLAHPPLLAAICAAERRGCEVQVLLERDYLRERRPSETPLQPGGAYEANRAGLAALLRSRVDVRIDRYGATLHSNTLVIDGGTPAAAAALSSANFDSEGLTAHSNSLVTTTSPPLVAAISEDLRVVRDQSLSEQRLEPLLATAAGLSAELVLGPTALPEARLIELVDRAEQSIQLAMFSFSLQSGLHDAMRRALDRGVVLSGIIEHDSFGQWWSAAQSLNEQGARLQPVELTDDRRMHHKLMVVDDRVVMTGTFNFSASARRNHETVVLLDIGASDPASGLISLVRHEIERLNPAQ